MSTGVRGRAVRSRPAHRAPDDHGADADGSRAGGSRAGGSHHPWAGTGHLLRLALRRDRVRIPLWVLALAGTTALTVPALEEFYGGDGGAEARTELTENPAGVLMLGPSFGVEAPSLGAMTANEVGMTILVATAVMGILLTVRHTRAEEEAGRTDVVRALRVGRFAPAGAALLLTFTAMVAVVAGLALALVTAGLDVGDSAVFALSVGLVGAAFGAVAGVTAQLARHPRGATGLALAALGVAFALRGVGDVLEPAQGSALSWTSPLAWAQQTRVFIDTRVWPLALLLALTVALVALAAVLGVRRDLGAGLLPERTAPDRAGPALAGPLGLAWRQLRGAAVGWALALALFAAAFGSLTDTMTTSIAEIPQLADWIRLDPDAFTDSISAVMLLYLSLGTAAFVAGAVVALRREETHGSTALAVVAGSSRLRWLGSWLAVALLGAAVVQVSAGAALGAGVAVSTGEWDQLGRVTLASLGYLPGVLVVGALGVALYGLAPRWTALAWAAFAYVAFVAMAGELLDLPAVLLNASPLQATPAVPLEDADGAVLGLLGAVGVVLVGVGAWAFRRRDLTD